MDLVISGSDRRVEDTDDPNCSSDSVLV